jgi:hypothetical protein
MQTVQFCQITYCGTHLDMFKNISNVCTAPNLGHFHFPALSNKNDKVPITILVLPRFSTNVKQSCVNEKLIGTYSMSQNGMCFMKGKTFVCLIVFKLGSSV